MGGVRLMEKLIREYEESGQLMQEREVTTASGLTHIIRKPVPQEPTKVDLLEQLKQEYLRLIRDAKDLGDEEEVTRLQQEYQSKKTGIEQQD